MRSVTDGTERLIETPDSTTAHEAEVPKEETPTANAHHPGDLEKEEGRMVEAMAEKSMRSVTGGDSNPGFNMCHFSYNFTSGALH